MVLEVELELAAVSAGTGSVARGKVLGKVEGTEQMLGALPANIYKSTLLASKI